MNISERTPTDLHFQAAALAILDRCHGGSQKRDLTVNQQKRFLPVILAIAASWNMVAVTSYGSVAAFHFMLFQNAEDLTSLRTLIIGALANILAQVFKLVFNDDDVDFSLLSSAAFSDIAFRNVEHSSAKRLVNFANNRLR